MSLESAPLLDDHDDGEEDVEQDKIDYKQMVWFHGKELVSKSFVRTPQPALVRLGIGKEGVYKIDSKTAKVLKHWRFSEIKDSNYSGYSFTLQLLNEADYFVRTDDGESICSYIEAFQKNPADALEQALNNPPMSQVPESGVLTLRRKFSSEPRSAVNDVKFFTLNRRRNKNTATADPLSKFTHNVDVDSRLRSEYKKDITVDTTSLGVESPRTRALSFGSKTGNDSKKTNEIRRQKSLEGYLDGKVNGVNEGDKKHARDILTHKLEEASQIEKRHSNGILMSPVSTKGEVTMTQSTKSSPASTHTTSPLVERKKFIKSPSPSPASSQPVVENSTSSKEAEPFKESVKETSAPNHSKTEVVKSKNRPNSSSDDRAPLLRQSSSSSSGTFSPTDEFRFVTQGPSSSREGSKEPEIRSSSTASEEVYDKLEAFVGPRPNSVGSFSGSDTPNSRGTPAGEHRLVKRDSRSGSEERTCMSSSPESGGSGVYDHLPALRKSDSSPGSTPVKIKNLGNISILPMPMDFHGMSRRNISQPALSTPVSARESPVDRGPSSASIREESSDEVGTPTNSDDEIKIGEDEGKAHFEQVKLREKKKKIDPFAELLSPQSNARLRWSQELNPLYDYIKGFKISDGVKLYDTPSKLLESANASDLLTSTPQDRSSYKTPSVIVEEDSEYTQSSREETISPFDSALYSPPSDASRPTSSFSESATSFSPTRRPHQYEEVNLLPEKTEPKESLPKTKGPNLLNQMKRSSSAMDTTEGIKRQGVRSATLNLGQLESGGTGNFRAEEVHGRSPRIGKRELQQQRRSRTIASMDDTEAVKKKQRPVRASDELKDFSFVMREYRLFFIKLPNGHLHREIFSINKPVNELKERLADILGIDNADNYLLYVEGACLTTIKEIEGGSGDLSRINRTGSLTHLVDSQSLPDQGSEPMLLKSNLSLRMQGVTTSRIMALLPDDEATDSSFASPTDICSDIDEEFHKDWVSVVQGITPVGQDDAVKLAALQYQAYFLDRTAVHSTIGFCRPTEFLPVEYAGIRGLEQRMYREQEALKSKSHSEVHEGYTAHCSKLASYKAVFFPVREPRKKLLHSTKLKPVLLGISSRGILRVDPKTKDILDFWDFMVLKNWAYSKRTFVLAFANKNYPVESNQSKWISELVDFYVDSIVTSDRGLPFLAPEDRTKV